MRGASPGTNCGFYGHALHLRINIQLFIQHLAANIHLSCPADQWLCCGFFATCWEWIQHLEYLIKVPLNHLHDLRFQQRGTVCSTLRLFRIVVQSKVLIHSHLSFFQSSWSFFSFLLTVFSFKNSFSLCWFVFGSYRLLNRCKPAASDLGPGKVVMALACFGIAVL